MKHVLTLIPALALCLGLSVPALAAEFNDVPADHAFYDAIMDCAERGVIGSYADGTFKPANTVTRSNFCVMLSRAFYPSDVSKYSTQANLKYGAFMPNYIALRENGVLENTAFSATDSLLSASAMGQGISRYDMAQLLSNILRQKAGDAAARADAAQVELADYASIPQQYQEAVKTVFTLGVVTGYADGSFGGETLMNRGQAAAVIYRMLRCVSAASAQPEPSSPETPAIRTLADGSAVTEENVMRLLEAAHNAKKDGPWGDPDGMEDVYPAGKESKAGQLIRATYRTTAGSQLSLTNGFGGYACYLSDAAFGADAPVRRTTFEKLRAGDIAVWLFNGRITHIYVYSGKAEIKNLGNLGDKAYYSVYEAGAGSTPEYTENVFWAGDERVVNYASNTGSSFVFYTRYLT